MPPGVVSIGACEVKRRLLVAVLAMGISTVLTADSGGPSINLPLSDSAHSPGTFTVPAAATAQLHGTSNGSVEHEVAIMKKRRPVTPPLGRKHEGKIRWALYEILPGAIRKAAFTTPPAPGDYQLVDGLAGHIENSTAGTLTGKWARARLAHFGLPARCSLSFMRTQTLLASRAGMVLAGTLFTAESSLERVCITHPASSWLPCS